uniref:Uncharacterized protein n=1 Tax=Rhizophora mucronata TaxID=61149 RepID=A0A2P2M4Y1_RHIMU
MATNCLQLRIGKEMGRIVTN